MDRRRRAYLNRDHIQSQSCLRHIRDILPRGMLYQALRIYPTIIISTLPNGLQYYRRRQINVPILFDFREFPQFSLNRCFFVQKRHLTIL